MRKYLINAHAEVLYGEARTLNGGLILCLQPVKTLANMRQCIAYQRCSNTSGNTMHSLLKFLRIFKKHILKLFVIEMTVLRKLECRKSHR